MNDTFFCFDCHKTKDIKAMAEEKTATGRSQCITCSQRAYKNMHPEAKVYKTLTYKHFKKGQYNKSKKGYLDDSFYNYLKKYNID